MSNPSEPSQSLASDLPGLADAAKPDPKAERLAAALRANLKRRKTAERVRRSNVTAEPGSDVES